MGIKGWKGVGLLNSCGGLWEFVYKIGFGSGGEGEGGCVGSVVR